MVNYTETFMGETLQRSDKATAVQQVAAHGTAAPVQPASKLYVSQRHRISILAKHDRPIIKHVHLSI